MVTKTINGTTYDSDTSFAGYSYVPNILTLAGDIMVEADARSGAVAQFTFSTTTTDADPGAGLLRLNQATQNTATVVYVDLADADGADVTAMLDALDDSTSATKGWLMLRQRNDKTKWLLFRLTAVTSASGYRKLTVALIASSAASPFADGAPLLMGFARTGDKGETGTLSLTVGTLTGSIDADGFNITDVGNLTASTATITTATVADLTIDFATFEQAGQHAATISTSVSGEVILADTGAPYRAYTITGDTTLLVAGPTTPGYVSGGYRVVVEQGGAGGFDVTTLPANLWTQSNAIDHADWAKTRTTTSTAAGVAPDGQTTAVKLVEDGTAASTHQLTRSLTKAASSLTYTFEGTFERDGRNIQIVLDDGTGSNGVVAYFNLQTGALIVPYATVGSGFTATSAAISAEPTGGYNVKMTCATNTATTLRAVFRLMDDADAITYNGDSASGVKISWLNLVEGSVALGRQIVGATRAGQVVWPNADEPDWPAQAAGVVTEISLLPAYDGNIHCYKIRGG